VPDAAVDAVARVQAALYVAESGEERCLFDPNPLSADGTLSLDWWEASDDGRFICIGLSEGGSEDSTLHILEVESGRRLADAIPHCRLAATCFEPDNSALLYTSYPAPGSVPAGEEHYRRRVFRHPLGADPEADELVFGESLEPTHYVSSISLSDDGRWTCVTVARGWAETSVYLRGPGTPFEAVFDGRAQLHAWFAGDRLVGLTNLAAPRYRLVEINSRRPEPASWRDVIPEGPDVLVDRCRPAGWPLDRDPYYLECSLPGVFVAGDVRAESVKRVASAVGEGAMAVTLVHRYLEDQ